MILYINLKRNSMWNSEERNHYNLTSIFNFAYKMKIILIEIEKKY